MGIWKRLVNIFLEYSETLNLEIQVVPYAFEDESGNSNISIGSTAMNFYNKYFNVTHISGNLYSISK